MANPSWITSENIKFNGTLDNAAVLATVDNVRSAILWDPLSPGDKTILTNFVTNHGGALPLSGAKAGYQIVNFNKTLLGATATGLNNVSTATAAKATIDVGGDKSGGTASGLSVSNSGYEVANFGGTVVSGDATGLLPTAGYQYINFSALTAGSDATGLLNDAAATAGKSTLAFTAGTAITPTTALGLAAANFDLNFAINGAGAVNKTVACTGASTLTTIATAFNALPVTGVTLSAVGNALVATTTATGATATVAITAGTTVNLIAAINTAKTATHTITNVAGTAIVVTTYTATTTIDGVAKPISIHGHDALTFTTLVAQLNTAVGAAGTVTLDVAGKRIKIASATTGSTSSVLTVQGTLFAAPLANFTTISAAVAGTGSHAALRATVTVDGVLKNISVAPSAITTFGDLITEINADLDSAATAAITGGNIKITSATTGINSKVVIGSGTLFPALPGYINILPYTSGNVARTYSAIVYVDNTYIRPVNFTGVSGDTFQHVIDEINTDLHVAVSAGYQEVKFGVNKVGTSATGFANDATTYTAVIKVDDSDKTISVAGSAAQTFTDLITEINTDLSTSATAALVNGALRVTSATTGTSSSVVITDTDLFKTLPNYLNVYLPMPGLAANTIATAAITGNNIVITSASTGLSSSIRIDDGGSLFNRLTGYVGINYTAPTAPINYLATITVDGVAKPISIKGSTAQTYTDLITEINTDLSTSATAALTASTAGYQTVTFTATKVGGTATGLPNTAAVYTATITVDGVDKLITVTGSTAQTYTNLITQINTDLGSTATASIANGGIKVISATTSITSSVSIVDTGSNPLFASLTNFSVIDIAVMGTDSDISITSATTGVASTVSIVDNTLFCSVGAKGFKTPVNGITSLLDTFTNEKTGNGNTLAERFKIVKVGLKPSVPTTPATLPKTPQYTYYATSGGWKYLADDAAVNA